jgi:hypothetical protein|nr:hypothetical protein [Neorhizobium tomejilense]
MPLTGDACGGSQQISHAQHSRSLSALVGENCDFRKIYWFVHIARFFVTNATHMVAMRLVKQDLEF